jgi:DNA-binding NarL/FixJ family response regulator
VSERKLRVVLCDDVALLRELTRHGLEEDPRLEVVGEAGEAEGGIRCTSELLPDAILLDLSMPGMDGLEAIPLIRAASPDTAIVVFSGFSADRLGPQAIGLGADRYVQKGTAFHELREILLDVCRERGVAA